MRVNRLNKSIIILSFLCILLFIVACSQQPSPDTTNQQDNLKDKSPEEVLEQFISYLSYDNVDERVKNIRLAMELSDGVVLDSLDSSDIFHSHKKEYYYNFKKLCEEPVIVGDITVRQHCENVTIGFADGSVVNILTFANNNIERSARGEILNLEVLENSSDSAKIFAQTRTTTTLDSEETAKTNNRTYFLKRSTEGWKVIDFINNEGELISEKFNVPQQREKDRQTIQSDNAFYESVKQGFDEQIQPLIQEQAEIEARTPKETHAIGETTTKKGLEVSVVEIDPNAVWALPIVVRAFYVEMKMKVVDESGEYTKALIGNAQTDYYIMIFDPVEEKVYAQKRGQSAYGYYMLDGDAYQPWQEYGEIEVNIFFEHNVSKIDHEVYVVLFKFIGNDVPIRDIEQYSDIKNNNYVFAITPSEITEKWSNPNKK